MATYRREGLFLELHTVQFVKSYILEISVSVFDNDFRSIYEFILKTPLDVKATALCCRIKNSGTAADNVQ